MPSEYESAKYNQTERDIKITEDSLLSFLYCHQENEHFINSE